MNEKPQSRRYSEGMATRREVLGDAYVNASEAGKDEFNDAFLTLIAELAWGHVWSRSNWTRRERSIVTIALLAGLSHHEELSLHIRAIANTGATMDDVREALLHVAIYAGIPAANSGMKVARKTFDDLAKTQ